MLQVFWGLLACEILNGKGRDVVEHTSLKKMRELIEKKFGPESSSVIVSQEHTQMISWMLHWLLVYSFTAKDLTNAGLFATIIANTQAYGHHFLNVIQMRSQSLLRYMIASFLLARGQPNHKYQINKNALEDLALPLALQDCQGRPDSFSSFLKAIYEDYDLDKAIESVETMTKEANDDFLLRNYIFDIKKQAYILIFQTKCKLYRTVDLEEIASHMGAKNVDSICEEVQRHLSADGFAALAQNDDSGRGGTISCSVKRDYDSEQEL